MSLKIWLPLTQDLRNQGTSNISVINNGATIANNGKLGKCYSFNGSSQYLQLNEPIFNNSTTELTYSCWFKTNSTTNAECLFSQRTAASYAGLTIFIYGTSGAIIFDDGARWQVTPQALTAGTWYHLTFVRNAQGKFYYINGILKASTTTLGTLSQVNTTMCSIGASQNGATSISGNFLNGYINDVRIYDHALSISEIKELAKGLVAHYPLNNNGLGNVNLLTKTRPSVDGIGAMGSYNGGSALVDNNITFNGYPTIKITPSSSNTSSGVWNKYVEAVNLKSGVTYTYSCWIYSTVADTFSSSSLGHFQTYTSSAMHNCSISHEGDSIPANTWTHVYITFTPTVDCKFYSFWIYFANTSQIIYIAEPKLEVGTKATKWCPNIDNGYLSNGSIVKDTSGNGHHGIITGALTSSNDTMQNSSSTVFNGASYIRLNSPTNEVRSVSFWGKLTNPKSSTYQVFFADSASELAFGVYTQIICNCGSSRLIPFANTNFIDGQWNHIVVTRADTFNDVNLYINGVKQSHNSAPANYWGNTAGVLDIGSRSGATSGSGPLNGCISDFRVYAVQLTDDDVLKLYNIGIKIDNKQNLYSNELKEPLAGASSNQFLKTGVIQTDELSEDTVTKIFKDGTILTNTYYEF